MNNAHTTIKIDKDKSFVHVYAYNLSEAKGKMSGSISPNINSWVHLWHDGGWEFIDRSAVLAAICS